MVHSTVLVNNLVPDENSVTVDPMSQLFVRVELMFGLNRVHMLDKLTPRRKIFATIYAVSVNIALSTLMYFNCSCNDYQDIKSIIEFMAYTFNVIYSFFACNKLKLYFHEIDKFDRAVSCRPKLFAFLKQHVMLHIILMLILIIEIVAFFMKFLNAPTFRWQFLAFHLVQMMELYFLSHLFCIINPRIKLINFFFDSSSEKFDITDISQWPKGYEYFSKHKIKKLQEVCSLMDMYLIIVNAHAQLINGIKWQFLSILVTSFISTLQVSYYTSLQLLGQKEDSPWNQWVTIASMCFVVGNIMCLLLPCVHRDQLQYEVRRLRMLVALRLYENKMNKRSRVSARALLALTGAHGLGVSLLGMLRVDISLPLHYVSLLVTYLIILLQFQKVNRV